MNTAFAIEKRVKWHTLSGVVNIGKQYSNEYVKIIVLFDQKKDSLNSERSSARKAKESYKSVDDLFISELWKDVHNKVIN